MAPEIPLVYNSQIAHHRFLQQPNLHSTNAYKFIQTFPHTNEKLFLTCKHTVFSLQPLLLRSLSRRQSRSHWLVAHHRLSNGCSRRVVGLAEVSGSCTCTCKRARTYGARERPQHNVRPFVACQARSGLKAGSALLANVLYLHRWLICSACSVSTFTITTRCLLSSVLCILLRILGVDVEEVPLGGR